ncbi:NAD-binding protein [Actinopolymorpha alba]|uniref:NAD-binding protein n=1 Tax=Actinopolymorpha alba TaxID=533267 RepID=UPI000360B721|nr:NAD-binding protein [Actinopolymorpha alba]
MESGHYVVCGDDTTTVRLVEELRAVREAVTVVVPDPDSDYAQDMERLGATLVVAPRPHEAALREAGVATARAVALVRTDDVGNVHAALTVEELNPQVRLVVHIVNPRLGDHLERLATNCTVLSAAAMAAPQFVAAALDESSVQWISVGGREVVAGPANLVTCPPIAGLARVGRNGQTKLLPTHDADLVLGAAIRQKSRRVHPRFSDLLTDLGRVFDRRLRFVGLGLLVFISVGTLILWKWPHRPGDGLSWLDALYIAVSTVTLTGFDDPRTTDAAAWVRLVGVGVQLLGLVMVSLLTAAIVDTFVGSSLARSFGGVRGRPRGHIVVCGLGTVGAQVAERLHQRGFNVVAIERDPDRAGIQLARRLRIPVIVGDVSNDAVLYDAMIHRARALVAVTNDDVANLQAGLYARERNPDARVVLRVFDHDLAGRVQQRLGLGTTRSVSILAAPAFAAEMLERRVGATVPAGRRVLLVTELPVGAGSGADGGLLGDLVEPGEVRVLAYRPFGGRWDWDASLTTPLHSGDRVALVTTRAGLASALLATRPVAPV